MSADQPATAAGLRRHLLIVGLRLRIAWRSVLLWRDRGQSTIDEVDGW